MKTVNMHEAKTHLSRLVEGVLRGEPFVIACAGKPLIKVTVADNVTVQRIAFLAGKIDVPEGFDTMGEAQIRAFFEGGGAEQGVAGL